MRAVVQRVKEAACTVDGQVTGRIQKGLLVFLGAGPEDGQADIDYLVDKIVHLRIFSDEQDKMNLDVGQVGGGVLLISQFTLYGDCRKGRRPDFSSAGKPEAAKELYEQTIVALRRQGIEVQTGIFAAMMEIACVNDGPVTMLLDSRRAF
jgi:D-tyrosyl-tRNA(Tyr) deacylase